MHLIAAYKLSLNSYCTKKKAHSSGHWCTRVCLAQDLPPLATWTSPSLFLPMKCLCPLGGPCKAAACTQAPGYLRESWGQLWPCSRVSKCRGGWISAHHPLPRCPPPNSGPQVYSALTSRPFQHDPIQRLAPPHSSGFRIKVQSEVFSDGPPRPGQACAALCMPLERQYLHL